MGKNQCQHYAEAVHERVVRNQSVCPQPIGTAVYRWRWQPRNTCQGIRDFRRMAVRGYCRCRFRHMACSKKTDINRHKPSRPGGGSIQKCDERERDGFCCGERGGFCRCRCYQRGKDGGFYGCKNNAEADDTG